MPEHALSEEVPQRDGSGTTLAEASAPLRPKLRQATLSPGLNIVATPIGNLGDVTLRALATLAGADMVLAEDTRVTRRLFAHYGLSVPLEAYHEHNAERVRPAILAKLRGGARIALVSDAGTPLISDPGFKLVEAALAENIAVTGLPGPSSVLAALMIAGLPTDRFFFEGFLPQKEAARRGRLAQLANVPGTLVIFEAPRRLAGMLKDAAAMLGERKAAVTRELTKLFEEVRRGSLGELAYTYSRAAPPKGEVVVVIGPPGEEDAPAKSMENLDERITKALEGHSLKEAVSRVAADTGLPRREVYARALELTKLQR
ncbi:MAG: 16S rRNA (cytidine(1402)-2'-O)-methyltransferase [Hyphomicrobiales bacterium]|nr:16S rRNA (cytidine(1402)-2'-O)-methyltransferase [Hyphomicrobiales bacterium]